MSVTYGFYNSKNHDRRYNVIQMSSIFDGIIRDGIFMSIGECLVVSATGEDMVIRVGEGRAWFNHTWTLNDSKLPLEVPQSEIILNRIDAVVLEVNSDNSVRENSIKIIKGTPSSNPVRPEMIHTASVNQYPLAFIKVDKEVTAIRQADITNMVGSDSAPYVTGILETVNIEAMVAQWEDQWVLWLEEKAANFAEMDEAHKAQIEQWTKDFEDYISISKEEFDVMIQEQTQIMLDTKTEWNNTWLQWFGQYTSTNENAFNTWFENLQAMLEPDVAANLANEILKLQDRTDKLEKFRTDLLIDHAIYDPIKDRKGEAIQDSMGRDILGRTIFLTAGSAVNGGGNAPTPGEGGFPQSLDEYYEELDKFADVTIRRSTFRGKCLDNLTDSEWERIRNGVAKRTYDGLFIGDYWTFPEIEGKHQLVDNLRIVNLDFTNAPALMVMPDSSIINEDGTVKPIPAIGSTSSSDKLSAYGASNIKKYIDTTYDSFLREFFDQDPKKQLMLYGLKEYVPVVVNSSYGGWTWAGFEVPSRPPWYSEITGHDYYFYKGSSGSDYIGQFVMDNTQFPLFCLKPEFMLERFGRYITLNCGVKSGPCCGYVTCGTDYRTGPSVWTSVVANNDSIVGMAVRPVTKLTFKSYE